jgi:hypothetical protein
MARPISLRTESIETRCQALEGSIAGNSCRHAGHWASQVSYSAG